MTVSGSISFLEAGGDGRDVLWLLVVKNTERKAPEIEVRRFPNAGDTLDKRHGKLELEEANQNGGAAAGSEGFVRLKLKGTPVTRGGDFVWEVKLKARPGGPRTRLVLGGRVPDGTPDAPAEPGKPPAALPVLAEISATSTARAQLNASSLVVQRLVLKPVPRLSVGINQTTPPDPPKEYRGLRPGPGSAAEASDGSSQNIAALLYRVFVLLDRPGTLDPVWDRQSLTRTSEVLAAERFRADPERTAEEFWARQVAEMLCFVPYGGPAAQYGISRDEDLMSDGVRSGATNPRYGLSYACQHLANFGVISRGFQQLPAGQQLAAGAFCAFTVTAMGGTWFTADTTNPQPVSNPNGDPNQLGAGPLEPDLRQTIAAIDEYGPGAVHLFSNRPVRRSDPARYEELNRRFAQGTGINGRASAIVDVTDDRGRTVVKELTVDIDRNRDPERKHTTFLVRADRQLLRDNQDDPHVGFVLRVRKSQQDPGENRIQTLDTGGFGVRDRGNGVSVLRASRGFHSGIFDDPLTTTIRSGKHPFRGSGVFPALTRDSAQNLEAHVRNVLQKARPLGLARLVLLKRSPPVNSVDQMLQRGIIVYASPVLTMYLNASDAVSERSNYAISRYVWSLRNLPGREDLKAMWMIYLPLGALASAMITAQRNVSAVDLAQQAAPGEPPAQTLHRLTAPIADIAVNPDGTVEITGRAAKGKPHAIHKLESRFNPPIRLPMDRAFPESLGNESSFPPYFRRP